MQATGDAEALRSFAWLELQRDLQLFVRGSGCSVVAQSVSEPEVVIPFLAGVFDDMHKVSTNHALAEYLVLF